MKVGKLRDALYTHRVFASFALKTPAPVYSTLYRRNAEHKCRAGRQEGKYVNLTKGHPLRASYAEH